MDRQYSAKSVSDKGTLYQLKQVVNRTSFGKEPKHNMKATEDFIEVVLYSHILAAAKECSDNSPNMSCDEIAKQIVERFVKITIPSFDDDETPISDENTSYSEPTDSQPASSQLANSSQNTEENHSDSVHSYAIDLLSTALFWHAFHDAIRKVMVTGLFVTGNSWQPFFGRKSIIIMLTKL